MQVPEVDGGIVITNVRLPYADKGLAAKIWSVECRDGRVITISPQKDDGRSTVVSDLNDPMASSLVDAQGDVMLPS